MAKVTIYSTPTCGYCNMAKEFFKEKSVEYTEINVAEDQQAAEDMVKKTGQMGVPVIVVAKDDGTEEVLIGFDQEKVATAVGVSA